MSILEDLKKKEKDLEEVAPVEVDAPPGEVLEEVAPDEEDPAPGEDLEEDSPPVDALEETGGNADGTFPAAYVKKLRKENAGYRERAATVDALEEENGAMAARLHTALVAADGRLADPSDLPFSPEYLEDETALSSAITELIAKRPGLKARNARGDIGAGKRGTANKAPASLVDMINKVH